MSDLDDKLRDIDEKLSLIIQGLPDPDGGISEGDMNDGIAQIKQAFADDSGLTKLMQDMANLYINMRQEMLRLCMTPTPEKTTVTAHFSNGKLSELMTGQEWYERFSDEICKTSSFKLAINSPKYVFKAARRAAGVPDYIPISFTPVEQLEDYQLGNKPFSTGLEDANDNQPSQENK